MAEQYVAVVLQGLVEDIKAVGVGTDKESLQQQADAVAKALQPTGEALGYTAQVLTVEPPLQHE